MKKIFKNTVFKTVAILLAISTVLYFIYQYLKGKTNSENPLLGNFNRNSDDRNFVEMPTYSPINSLFERAKLSQNVAIEFSEDMILKDDFGKTFEVKKGKVIKGELDILMVTGGTITAMNSKYYLQPLDIYGIKRVEIVASKVVSVMDLESYNKVEAYSIVY